MSSFTDNKLIQNVHTAYNIYWARIRTALATIRHHGNAKAYMAMCEENGITTPAFSWFGEAGAKFRTSGILNFFTNAYSLYGTNDAVQATSTSQPYRTGDIAPNERWGMKNPNGAANFMTHPTITYATNDAWSVSFMANHNGLTGILERLCQSATANTQIRYQSNQLMFFNESGTQLTFLGTTSKYNGKNTLYQLVANGLGSISLYINGVLINTSSIATNAVFDKILINNTSASFCGILKCWIIKPQALTQSQVTAEYNFFRALYPEIESVVIGTKNVATSNLEVVANGAGTLIPDGTVTGTWVAGTAFWCHHTDIATGATYGKLYNLAGKNVIVASPPSGWHVSTEAENTALAALGGAALKMSSASWWTTANGTNTTGYTALGGGKRNADGSFSAIKGDAYFWCADSNKVLHITDAGVATIEAVTSVNDGYSIRLIKD